MSPGLHILLADDEPTIALTLTDALTDAGHRVVAVEDTESALAQLATDPPDLVLTDVRMPGAGGMAVLERSLEQDADRPVIVITGFASVDQAVDAMGRGAAWYVQKPFHNEAVVALVDRFAKARNLAAENRELKRQLSDRRGLKGLAGASQAMEQVVERLRTVAPTEATVLIQGESGTGKERIAQALHELSSRKDGAFVALSCAALPESLLEAELFGHEQGAFTDAKKSKRGRVELADGGTLFLDDIDDMPAAVQVKLLRVLQERTYERVGGEETLSVDMRVIAATKVDLREEVREGRFREDLYYRIHVVPLLLPPLRERRGDVPLIAEALIRRHFEPLREDEPLPTIDPQTLKLMERYPWPGNVRELENAILRALALRGQDAQLKREHLLSVDERWRGALETPETVEPLRDVLKAAEAQHLPHALELTGGHRTQTAELLGISRKVLWEKLKEHGIGADESEEG
ncbi:MAG: sigma-54-dependent transcriptional regulator [Planctomycetota bacterium]